MIISALPTSDGSQAERRESRFQRPARHLGRRSPIASARCVHRLAAQGNAVPDSAWEVLVEEPWYAEYRQIRYQTLGGSLPVIRRDAEQVLRRCQVRDNRRPGQRRAGAPAGRHHCPASAANLSVAFRIPGATGHLHQELPLLPRQQGPGNPQADPIRFERLRGDQRRKLQATRSWIACTQELLMRLIPFRSARAIRRPPSAPEHADGHRR